MSSPPENSLFSDENEEEQFIKENLSFLLEPEEECVENIRFICREVEGCVYKTSLLGSSTIMSWSIFSNGSICSSRVKPSKFSSLNVQPNLFGVLNNSLTKSCDALDSTFLTNILEGYTSTPIKRQPEILSFTENDFEDDSFTSVRARNKDDTCPDYAYNSLEPSFNLNHQFGDQSQYKEKWSLGDPSELTFKLEDYLFEDSFTDDENNGSKFLEICTNDEALDISLDASLMDLYSQENSLKNCVGNENKRRESGAYSMPLKVVKEAPIALLNEISKLNTIIYEDVSEEENDTVTTISDSSKVSKSSNSKPTRLTIADFIPKEMEEPKPIVDFLQTDVEDKENKMCKFCFKNGELPKVYAGHETKTSQGIVVCPILRKYVCDLCGETGDTAHTRKYCPLNTERFAKKPFFRRLSNGILTTYQNHK